MSNNGTIIFKRGKNTGSSSTSEESSVNDIWDDTLLIKAYDKAIEIARDGCLEKESGIVDIPNKSGKKFSEKRKWKIGDKCRCRYSGDLKFYEADIVEIMSATGMCTVKYIGYENMERVPLKNLKVSTGESARLQQIQDAANDNEINEMNGDENTYSDLLMCENQKSKVDHNKPVDKKKNQRKTKSHFINNEDSPNLSFPQGLHSIIPPPPPPHMFRNLCEDENETEAMSAMLISWYMSGYHTGYYQGLKMAKKQC